MQKLVNAKSAAEILGTTSGNLAQWRNQKRHDLPYVKIGTRVLYDVADLTAFVESRKVRPSGQELEIA